MGAREVKESIWGENGRDAFDRALTACHEFAQTSNCPLGYDVFRWLVEQHERLVYADNAAKNA